MWLWLQGRGSEILVNLDLVAFMNMHGWWTFIFLILCKSPLSPPYGSCLFVAAHFFHFFFLKYSFGICHIYGLTNLWFQFLLVDTKKLLTLVGEDKKVSQLIVWTKKCPISRCCSLSIEFTTASHAIVACHSFCFFYVWGEIAAKVIKLLL